VRLGVILAGSSLVVAVTIAGASARAQAGGDKAAAEVLFEQAHALVEKGDYRQACPKYAESLRLDPGLGVMLHLASCWEKAGKPASAWAQYREAEQVAVRTGDSRAEVARKRAEALEQKLYRLTIVVPAAVTVDGLAVARDGEPVGRAQWGTAVPIDPGEHVIVAMAPGKQRWEGRVEAPDQFGSTSITVPVLADASAPAASAASSAPAFPEASAQNLPPDSAAPPASMWTTQRILAVGAGAVGVIGVGIGTYFGIVTKTKLDDSNSDGCSGNHCNSTGASLRNDAFNAGTVSTVAFVVGAVGLAGGAVLWFTAPSPTTPRVGAAVGPGGGTVVVGGAW
jgi:serine/threonine-protein kinase